MERDPSTNAAVEARRQRVSILNSLDEAPTDLAVTTDFVYEDRRNRTGGLHYGRVGRADYLRVVESNWDVSGGRPHFSVESVVAVRGRRSAALVERIDFGGDAHLENVVVVQFDPAVRLMRRRVAFDLEDVEGAVAELDRLHAEIDD